MRKRKRRPFAGRTRSGRTRFGAFYFGANSRKRNRTIRRTFPERRSYFVSYFGYRDAEVAADRRGEDVQLVPTVEEVDNLRAARGGAVDARNERVAAVVKGDAVRVACAHEEDCRVPHGHLRRPAHVAGGSHRHATPYELLWLEG